VPTKAKIKNKNRFILKIVWLKNLLLFDVK